MTAVVAVVHARLPILKLDGGCGSGRSARCVVVDTGVLCRIGQGVQIVSQRERRVLLDEVSATFKHSHLGYRKYEFLNSFK